MRIATLAVRAFRTVVVDIDAPFESATQAGISASLQFANVAPGWVDFARRMSYKSRVAHVIPPRAPAQGVSATSRLRIITIPSTDRAFQTHVERLVARGSYLEPEALGSHLRRMFPRVLVRARQIAGESDVWYVYRDGAWRPDDTVWWRRPNVPRLEMTLDGAIVDATPGARGLLAIDQATVPQLAYTDFFARGTLEDALAVFGIVTDGHALDATIRLRPLTGDDIACEIHATREGDRLVTYFRLAEDIPARRPSDEPAPRLKSRPEHDVVFAQYAEQALHAMIDPTPEELAIRLRRLYPHAQVVAAGDEWEVLRDRRAALPTPSAWWEDPGLPRVRYDERGLILEANDEALKLINPGLVGCHWHDFVTPGSTDEVNAVIEMIQSVGWAVSSFRMPSADGTLIEFDSYTRVDGDVLTTIIRPLGR